MRFRVHLASSFFAGIAGALSAIHYEIVTIDGMRVAASGIVMLMTGIGGANSFIGPVLGAVIVTFLQTTVSAYTHAWPFYFGLLFLVVIYCAPEGLLSLVTLYQPVWRARSFARPLPSYGAVLVSGLIVLAGVVAAVEAIYRFSGHAAASMLVLFGTVFSPMSAATWIFSAASLTVGTVLPLLSALYVKPSWKTVLVPNEIEEGVVAYPMRRRA